MPCFLHPCLIGWWTSGLISFARDSAVTNGHHKHGCASVECWLWFLQVYRGRFITTWWLYFQLKAPRAVFMWLWCSMSPLQYKGFISPELSLALWRVCVIIDPTGLTWGLSAAWFVFPCCLRRLNNFFHVFIGNLCFFFHEPSTPLILLVVKFLSSCIFWTIAPHQMSSWPSLSPVLSVRHPFTVCYFLCCTDAQVIFSILTASEMCFLRENTLSCMNTTWKKPEF